MIAVWLACGLVVHGPARTAGAQAPTVRVSGTVWVDENLDGVRQPTEPALSNVPVGVWTVVTSVGGGERYLRNVRTDNRGQYETQIERGGGVGYTFDVVYAEPGFVASVADPGSHKGCATLYPLVGDVERTVNVRVRRLVRADGGLQMPPDPLERRAPEGQFFKQTGSAACDAGFTVTDEEGIPFWAAWQELGLDTVGYPISGRFVRDGVVTQVFQKLALRWRPESGMEAVPLLDDLHERGFDPLLHDRYAIPPVLAPGAKVGTPPDAAAGLALLDADPAIRARYMAAANPLLVYGLPTAAVEDRGEVAVLRTQATALQHWQVETLWAEPGEVTVVNAGEIARDLGLFPADALLPQPPPRG